jgi:tight adherence protein C
MAILGALLGYVLPDMWLSNCVKRRQTLIERELAQFLDFWTSAVEAGLDLMPAVERIVVKLQGPLAHEFKLALQEVAVGYPRSVALEHLADRCGVPDLTQVIAVLVAAEQWGASVAEQLRACSQELWKQRTARARSRAGQISVAMQGPLLLLTLPGFLLMIMAPVAWHLQTLFN